MNSFPGLLKKIAAAAMVSVMLTVSVSAVEVGIVDAGALNMRSSNSTSSKIVAVAKRGAKVIILEKNGDWYRVNYDYEEGYMSAEYIRTDSSEDFSEDPIDGTVTGSVVNVRSKPDTSSTVLLQLRKGTHVKAIGVEAGWYKVKYGNTVGYIHPDYFVIEKHQSQAASQNRASESTAPSESEAVDTEVSADAETQSDLRSEIVEFARQLLGVKYAYGGRSPKTGFDCSGFVYYVFKNFGYTLNPGASNQMTKVKLISKNELLPGDLVFFNDGSAKTASHVGIYIGSNKFIHAVKPGKPVSINSLSESYYSRNYVGAGRVLS